MKDLILMITTLAMFLFGYVIARRVDMMMENNLKMLEKEQLPNKHLLKIAAETPMLLNAVSAALEYCTDTNADIEFAVSSGKCGKLLRNLSDGTADLVLLSEKSALENKQNFEFIRLSCIQQTDATEVFGLKVHSLDDNQDVYLLWNKEIPSHARDWFVLALKNSFCMAKCS